MKRTKTVVRLKVKEVAEQKGLDKWDLVARSGVDARVIERMLAGEWERLYLTQLAKVAEGLGVHIADLIEEEN